MRYEVSTERQGFAADVYGVYDNDTFTYVTSCELLRVDAQELADWWNADIANPNTADD